MINLLIIKGLHVVRGHPLDIAQSLIDVLFIKDHIVSKPSPTNAAILCQTQAYRCSIGKKTVAITIKKRMQGKQRRTSRAPIYRWRKGPQAAAHLEATQVTIRRATIQTINMCQFVWNMRKKTMT